MDIIRFRGIAAARFFNNEPYMHSGMGRATAGWGLWPGEAGWLAWVGGWLWALAAGGGGRGREDFLSRWRLVAWLGVFAGRSRWSWAWVAEVASPEARRGMRGGECRLG